MCRSSRAVKKSENATAGQTLGIGTIKTADWFPRQRIAAFHLVGQTAKDCVMCLPSASTVTLGLSVALQRKYGLNATETVRFYEGRGHTDDDFFSFKSGLKIPMMDLANKDVSVFFGVKHVEAPVQSDPLAAILKEGNGGSTQRTRELINV